MKREPLAKRVRTHQDPSVATLPNSLLDERGALVAFAERRLRSRPHGEELVQQVFVRYLESLGENRSPENPVAWAYRALSNAVVDEMRRRKVAERRASETMERGVEETLDDRPRPCGCVRKALAGLKEEEREILAEVIVNERPPSEIAADLGLTANAAPVRTPCARRSRQKAVASICGGCAVLRCVDCGCTRRHTD